MTTLVSADTKMGNLNSFLVTVAGSQELVYSNGCNFIMHGHVQKSCGQRIVYMYIIVLWSMAGKSIFMWIQDCIKALTIEQVLQRCCRTSCIHDTIGWQ